MKDTIYNYQDFPEYALKEEINIIKSIAKRLYRQGMSYGKAGNISIRRNNTCLITTSGSDMACLSKKDFSLIDLSSSKILWNDKKPSSELPVHKEIYELRKDVNAIIHSHPIYINAFGIAQKELNANFMPEAYMQLDKIETVEYKLPGSKGLAEAVLKKCAESNVIMLINHGAITLGKDIREAFYRMELFEAYAKTVFLADQLGKTNPLNDINIQELIAFKKEKEL